MYTIPSQERLMMKPAGGFYLTRETSRSII
jgi:hypothetical protein